MKRNRTELTVKDFEPQDVVQYIPMHAENDLSHPDCEFGIVSSVNATNVFVKFSRQLFKLGWHGTTSQSVSPSDLVKIGSARSPEVKTFGQHKLMACPFCKTHTEDVAIATDEHTRYYVTCTCGARGSVCDIKSIAILRWNLGSIYRI